MQERRHFSRIKYKGSCSIVFNDLAVAATLCDISLHGALLMLSEPLPQLSEEKLQVKFCLEGSEICLDLSGFVSNQFENFIGVQFTKMDIETISHLKRLVALNLEGTDGVIKEFTQLIKINTGDAT